MSIASIAPGWLIGYLIVDDGEECKYRALPVVTVTIAADGSINAVVMTPDGQMFRADELPGRAFAVEPTASFEKLAEAHAAGLGRSLARAVA